jgi:hypothetical protein
VAGKVYLAVSPDPYIYVYQFANPVDIGTPEYIITVTMAPFDFYLLYHALYI